MSHEANLYCITCNKADDNDFGYGDINLMNMIKIYMHTRRVFHIFFDNSPFGLLIEQLHYLSDFLNEHWNHEIVIKGEYENDNEIEICRKIN